MNWQIKKLGDLCQIKTGKSNAEDANPSGEYAFFDRSKIIKKSSRFLFDCEALIIPGEGSVFLPRYFSGKFDLHQRAYALYNFNKTVDIKFIQNYLVFNHKYFSDVAVGATAKSLRLRHFQDMEILIPSLSEQQRIVKILDDVFKKLEIIKENTQKNLLNSKDLLSSYKKVIFEKKQDWDNLKINDISENLDSKRIPITKNVRSSGNYPYYGASGVVDQIEGYIFDEDLLLVSEDGANLLARTYPIAFSITGKTWVNNHAHVLRFKNMELQKYVEFYLNSINMEPYVSGMAQPKLNQTMLNRIPIPIPSQSEIRDIVIKLDTLTRHSRKLDYTYQLKLGNLDELKKSILTQAFSGNL